MNTLPLILQGNTLRIDTVIQPKGHWDHVIQLPRAGRLIHCVSNCAIPATAIKITALQCGNINCLWPEEEVDYCRLFTGDPVVAVVCGPQNAIRLRLESRLTNKAVHVQGALVFDMSGQKHPLNGQFNPEPPGLFEHDYRVHASLLPIVCGAEFCPIHPGPKVRAIQEPNL